MFKRLTAEATRLPRIRTSCPPLQAAILRLKPHGSGFAELHRHFMQLEGRLQALPSYHPSHLKGWPHADGCMLTPFLCMHVHAHVSVRGWEARWRTRTVHVLVMHMCMCKMCMHMYMCCAGGAATTGGAAAARAWKAQVTDRYFAVGLLAPVSENVGHSGIVCVLRFRVNDQRSAEFHPKMFVLQQVLQQAL